MTMMETRRLRVDDQLLRALREGPDALPMDLNRLHGYLHLISGLLTEKAQEHEPDWAQALAAAAEIETLQDLERAVAEKAVDVPARTLWAVLSKLAIWESLGPCGEEACSTSQRDRLIDSVRADLERIARGSAGRVGRAGPY